MTFVPNIETIIGDSRLRWYYREWVRGRSEKHILRSVRRAAGRTVTMGELRKAWHRSGLTMIKDVPNLTRVISRQVQLGGECYYRYGLLPIFAHVAAMDYALANNVDLRALAIERWGTIVVQKESLYRDYLERSHTVLPKLRERPCKICEKLFSIRSQGQYCSDKCARIARHKRESARYAKSHKIRCRHCGIQIVTRDARRRFCSETCRVLQKRRATKKNLDGGVVKA